MLRPKPNEARKAKAATTSARVMTEAGAMSMLREMMPKVAPTASVAKIAL